MHGVLEARLVRKLAAAERAELWSMQRAKRTHDLAHYAHLSAQSLATSVALDNLTNFRAINGATFDAGASQVPANDIAPVCVSQRYLCRAAAMRLGRIKSATCR